MSEKMKAAEYEDVQAQTKLAAINVIGAAGDVQISEELSAKQAEVLAIIHRLAAAAGIDLGQDEAGIAAADEGPKEGPVVRCLKQVKEDFEKGIVLLDSKKTKDDYDRELQADRSAGQKWENIEAKLLDNNCAILRKLMAMPGGARFVGVYWNGDLAFRQRSSDIVNAVWEKTWRGDASKGQKGELWLLYPGKVVPPGHGTWANPKEVLEAVKAAGYHLPKDSPDYVKRGLVAASESLMGNYMASASKTKDTCALLEGGLRAVQYSPNTGLTSIGDVSDLTRSPNLGAILWLRV